MRRFVIIMVLTTHVVVAQQRLPGKVVVNNDTLDMQLLLPIEGKIISWEDIQWGVTFVDSDDKGHEAHADSVQAVIFTTQDVEITMAATKYTGTGLYRRELFLRLLVDGPVKLFSYHYTANEFQAGMAQLPAHLYLTQRGEGEMIPFNSFGFRKDIKKNFGDCPEIIAKTDSKEYKVDDIAKIIKYYNEHCAKQN